MAGAEPFPRYAPEVAFPPYAYVPGKHPHPATHPAGHLFGQAEQALPAPEPGALKDNEHFRLGVDLFNFGYYWEAHEIWEQLWHASGRTGELADFFKGLIKLAAAGVKAREGNVNGLTKHARRAGELFTQTGYLQLAKFTENLSLDPVVDATVTTGGNPILPTRLRLDDVVRE